MLEIDFWTRSIVNTEVRDFVYISDKAYKNAQILIMEKNILNALGFQLTVPNAYIFLQRFLRAANADRHVSMLSQYLTELALVDYSMLRFRWSKIAAAAVYLAHKCMRKDSCWSYALDRHTHYSVENLRLCVSALAKLQRKAPFSSLRSVFQKFSGRKYNEVAKIICNQELNNFWALEIIKRTK